MAFAGKPSPYGKVIQASAEANPSAVDAGWLDLPFKEKTMQLIRGVSSMTLDVRSRLIQRN